MRNERERRMVIPSIVGKPCIYCGNPATVQEHVIPKRLSPFFDAGWNLKPSCTPCNQRKSDTVAWEHVETPGNDPYEDAAIWATVYNRMDASTLVREALLERVRDDLGKWDIIGVSLAFGAFEVYTGRHFCAFWGECQERCATGGQLVELMESNRVSVCAPDGLQGLIHDSAWK